MQPDVQRDYDFGRQFLVHLRHIASELIREAPIHEDVAHATDLIVLNLEGVRIACRVRHHRYFLDPRYREQFTIRCHRDNGAKTELAKVLEGWGDYIIYGFADEDEADTLVRWLLGDLSVFRGWFHHELARLPVGQIPGQRCRNGDGTEFIALSVSDLPSEFVVAANWNPQSSLRAA